MISREQLLAHLEGIQAHYLEFEAQDCEWPYDIHFEDPIFFSLN